MFVARRHLDNMRDFPAIYAAAAWHIINIKYYDGHKQSCDQRKKSIATIEEEERMKEE